MYNVLKNHVVNVDHPDRSRSLRTIPGVLADCMSGKAESFPAVRAHQAHPWHAFLVQLGAIAMDKANLSEPPETEDHWHSIIQALTEEYPSHEPWQMTVSDPTVPAFLQPPIYDTEQWKGYNRTLPTPDRMDMLQTSTNHDVKKAVAINADPEDWLMALITVQTFQGYTGNHNYGISRMNLGNGNRPGISLCPQDANPGDHIRRDLRALVEFLPELRHNYPGYPDSPGAPALMWLMPLGRLPGGPPEH